MKTQAALKTLKVSQVDLAFFEKSVIDDTCTICAMTSDTQWNLKAKIKGPKMAEALIKKIKRVGVIDLANWEEVPEPCDYYDDERAYELHMHELSVRMHGEFGSFGNN